MLLPNDYNYMLLGCNNLLPIEHGQQLEKNYRQWYKRSQITIQKRHVINLQGRGKTRGERKFGWG